MSANIESDDNEKPRFSIVFEDESGNVTQDICIVQNDSARMPNQGVECLVFGDAYNESYTDKFNIVKCAVD